jgi:sRNA-binding protein
MRPAMTPGEALTLAWYASQASMYVEYGSGASTVQAAPLARKALSIVLHRHTTTTPYLKALLAAPSRFDLDGQPAGDIAEEHRQAAREEVERRRAIVAARRAAEGQARNHR